jgi:hypothetical protein
MTVVRDRHGASATGLQGREGRRRPPSGGVAAHLGVSFVNCIRTIWRRLGSHFGPNRCRSCDQPLRRLVAADLSPDVVRTRRLEGTLGGLLAAGYVCATCTKAGEWILIE